MDEGAVRASFVFRRLQRGEGHANRSGPGGHATRKARSLKGGESMPKQSEGHANRSEPGGHATREAPSLKGGESMPKQSEGRPNRSKPAGVCDAESAKLEGRGEQAQAKRRACEGHAKGMRWTYEDQRITAFCPAQACTERRGLHAPAALACPPGRFPGAAPEAA